MNDELLSVLKEEIELLDKSVVALEHSYNKCLEIGIKEKYSLEEESDFEALTSRFARASDMLIQKVFRLIEKMELEDEGTIRDTINRAEKREIIDSADVMVDIRKLRNNIAHEYLPKRIQEIYRNVLENCPSIFSSVEKTKNYCQKFLK